MPNAHIFPIVAYPGPAPELAARSGQGGWWAYALASPADRLLPFVLTRLITTGQGRWINCAFIVDADTEEVLESLTPTGATAGPPATLGLVLDKVIDTVQGVEYFLYYGAIIPGLSLPCGRPLRLLLDNEWQSPRFQAVTNLSGYQRLEWSHPGPLSGIPYGTGLVQRLYVKDGGLQYTAPREVATSTQDATTGAIRNDFTAEYTRRTTTAGPYPAYLLDALANAKPHGLFSIDGTAWRLIDAKEASSGPDGGRAIMTLTVEDPNPVRGRVACTPAPLLPVVFDPVADAPRPWRCGDTSDTAPDWQTFAYTCAESGDGNNTGYQNLSQRDENPNSTTHNNTRTVVSTTPDFAACPLPAVYYSAQAQGVTARNNCPTGETGSSVYYFVAAGAFTSLISQADADQKAVDHFEATRQADANTRGTCSTGGAVEWRPIYSSTGCFNCQMVNTNDPSDVRAATLAEAAMYYRQYADDGVYLCTTCTYS